MSNDDSVNQREFTRNRVHFDVFITTGTGVEIHGVTREVSMNGMFVECDGRLAEDTPCHAAISLADGGVRVEVEAQVASVRSSGLGLAFCEMSPESFGHLRRLVLYNADDTARAQSELDNHIGFKTRINP